VPLIAARIYSPEECVERAQALLTMWPSAAEVMRSYTQLIQYQCALLHSQLLSLKGEPGELLENTDFAYFVEQFQEFLKSCEHFEQQNLAQAARAVSAKSRDYLVDVLLQSWTDSDREEQSLDLFFARAFWQAVLQSWARECDAPASAAAPSTCPYCGRRPVCGVLRPEGDGAKRSLVCSMCSTEWPYRRLICPNCEQENVEQLPIYSAEQCAYIRIEACDRCRTFIKTIDLTKDGRAIPVVDEIASLPLTLWAEEKGYTKLQRNALLL